MISFIYFDLGGVAVDDFTGNNKWNELADEAGVPENKRGAFRNLWKQYESKFNTTDDIDELLLQHMEEDLGIELPANYSILTALVDRFYENKPIQPIIADMKSKTRIGLLTNISPGMLDLIKQKGILPNVEWDEIVDSSIEHVMKPDPRIFQIAQKRAGVSANEILFVDNKLSHCEAAADLDWQTFYYDSADRVKSAQELADFLASQQFSK